MSFYSSMNQEVKSLYPPMNLGWPCELLWPKESNGSDVVLIFSMCLRGLEQFHSLNLTSTEEQASKPLKDER